MTAGRLSIAESFGRAIIGISTPALLSPRWGGRVGVYQTFSHFLSKVAGAGRNRNCRNISRNLPVVSGAGRFDVGPRAGFGQVLAFWPVLASFASKISVL